MICDYSGLLIFSQDVARPSAWRQAVADLFVRADNRTALV